MRSENPSRRIPYGQHFIDEDDIAAIVAQLRSGSLTQGAAINAFEAKVSDYVGARYAVAVTSGTAALHLACLAGNLGRDENLVTSANTFVASANCGLYVGAKPNFADIDPSTLNLSPDRLEEKCRALGRVGAIVPVHFAGLACDMKRIREIAKRYDALVIEDASHALGGAYEDGSRVGNCRYADMTVFSFHPVKQITTGEGGMVTTNDEALYRDLLRLRSHGINKGNDPFQHPEQAFTDGLVNRWYYEMQEVGFNCRLTEIQAALGMSQLAKLDRFLERRKDLVRRYDVAFAGEPRGIRAAQRHGRGSSAHHLYVVRAPFGNRGRITRAAYMQRLYDLGIITQVHYIPVPLQPVYRKLGCTMTELPETQRYYDECLSIPLYFHLANAEQDWVVETLISAME